MSSPVGIIDAGSALPVTRQIDKVCNAFEAAWLAGQQPRIEEYLDDAPEPERSALLRELLAVEIEYLFQSGKPPEVTGYCRRFPKHVELVNALFNELANEPDAWLDNAESRNPTASQLPNFPAIPGYEIRALLGSGGMGLVYEAWQAKLDRLVALKTILAGANASPESMARFRTEAESLARLQHPNIVHIYEVFEHAGCPYLALEFVNGVRLDKKLAGAPQPGRAAAELIETLALAVHCAHRQGIVHRDLKPANVLLTADNVPKITDFGLAKQLEGNAGQTQSGAVFGTPSYMAPEQAAGDTKRIGPATDVYGLGAILYELLAGRPPFRAATDLATLEQVREQEPIRLQRLQPRIHRDIETICHKCLRKEPAKRYATAAALADDLRRFLDGEPVRARPSGLLERIVRSIKRRPAVTVLSALLVLVAFIGIAGVEWFRRDAEQARRPSGEKTDNRIFEIYIPFGLPAISIPSSNLITEGKVALGRQLFFDKRLSVDGTVACATCHDPARGWSNGKPLAVGANGKKGRRNVPSLVNVAYHQFLFWDGRASSLEEQALAPLLNPNEMAMPDLETLEERLEQIPQYRSQFQRVFGTRVTAENVAKALASFERTILAGDAPYDRFKAGDKTALSESSRRGLHLFFNKAHCSACHSGPALTFTDGGFHNIGIGVKTPTLDRGREAITNLLGDRASFKTPSLRDVARTAPYMHDGSFQTLEKVIEFYDRGGIHNPQLDEEIYPLGLTRQEKVDLATFLREGLTSRDYPRIAPAGFSR